MGILRTLLAIGVLICHSSPVFGISSIGGNDAIKAFFIISGFYMSLILNEKYTNVENSYKLFITNRLLRLYPLYFTILIITFLYQISILVLFDYKKGLGVVSFVNHFYELPWHSAAILIFTNLSIIGQEILFFFGFCDGYELCFTKSYDVDLHSFMLVPQAWTVGLELAFYLIAPFILKRSVYTIILIGLVSAGLRFFWFYSGQSFSAIESMFLPNELLFFMMGAISYQLYLYSKSWIIPVFVSRSVLFLIFAMSVFYEFLPQSDLKLYIYLVLLMLAVPIIFKFSKDNKIDRYIGELSYPLYISHLFILMVTRFSGFPKIESIGTTSLIATLIFSILLYEFIAKPIERYRQSRVSKS